MGATNVGKSEKRSAIERPTGGGEGGNDTARTGPSVLLAEDDDQLRAVFRRVLDAAGFRVLEAGSGAEALRIARKWPDGVDVLVTDVEMPGMSGPELAASLLADRPALPVIYVTGNPGSISDVPLDDRTLLFLKPLDLRELLEAVQKLTA